MRTEIQLQPGEEVIRYRSDGSDELFILLITFSVNGKYRSYYAGRIFQSGRPYPYRPCNQAGYLYTMQGSGAFATPEAVEKRYLSAHRGTA